jgi:phosphoglycerate dehydrogenase-like enzyme
VLLSDRSRGMIGAADLARMKPTAYLINTARAAIVDQAALLAVLTDRRIAGAGLDVFETEPLPLDSPLRKLNNVVITPHLGYVSVQAYEAYFRDMVENIRAFLDGKPIRVIPAG